MTNPLLLKSAEVGPWPMNSYALICSDTQQSVLIDPGAEPDTLDTLLVDTDPMAILLTHAHPDHVGALADMQARLQVPILMHPADSHMMIMADEWLVNGDKFQLGRHQLHVVHTPGHTPGMITFRLPDNRAIVGDTIFQGGPGKTWSPQDFQTTLQTMDTIVFKWPDNTVCYPGHGPSFRLGDERPAYAAFRQREHPADLRGDVTWG